MNVTAPAGTVGEVAVPMGAASAMVTVDGQVAWDGKEGAKYNATYGGGYVTLKGVSSGTHVAQVSGGVGLRFLQKELLEANARIKLERGTPMTKVFHSVHHKGGIWKWIWRAAPQF